MRLTHGAVDRPVFTSMVVAMVVLIGTISLVRLPIDLMPDISYPTLSIVCNYENAGPQEVEELITRPIEQAVSAVPGAEEVWSSSSEGQSVVRVTFSWGTDLDAAANDIRDRLDRVIPRLPEEADRPTLRKFDLASFPILILGASTNLDPIQARQIIEDQVQYRLERVPGVASVDVWGGLTREIHVDLDPAKINALAIPLDQIVNRIREGNINIPAGTIERANMEVTIRTPGQYTDLEQLRQTVVAVRQGVPIRLTEVADVNDSWQRITRIVRINGAPGMRLAVNKQSGRNTVQVARATLKEIAKINQDIPQIHIVPIIDTSQYITNSIKNIGFSAIFGGLLTIVVLLVFLRNIRTTLVVATAIPISIVGTIAALYLGGLTLNIMTLGGLALGVGMLVDNSIVVLENTFRLREQGIEPRRAAIDGTEEVTSAIIASTLTTLGVFLPLVLMQGMSGVMFKQLSIVVAISLAFSLIVAITLVPMLAARIPYSTGGLTRLFDASARAFKAIEHRYGIVLAWALGHKPVVIGAALLILCGALMLIPYIGRELMPQTDEGEVRIEGEMQVGTRLALVDQNFRLIEQIVQEAVPEMQNYQTSIGGGRWGSASHTGNMRISLKARSQRSRSSEQIAADLRPRLSKIPGMVVRTRAGQGLFILRMGTQQSDRVQVEIRGHDLQTADLLADQVSKLIKSVPGITDVRISREAGSPEELIHIDRQKAADMDLTVWRIANALQTIVGGTRAGYFRQAGKEYAILVRLRDAQNVDLTQILDLTITNSQGQPVVLRNVVEAGPQTGPVMIERKDQERIVTVSADVSGRDLGSVQAEVQQKIRSIPVPPDFTIGLGGDYEEQQKAYRELAISIILALVLVYMVMACQYESLLDPLVVMFSVPLAAIGVLGILFLTGTTINIQSLIGCIILGGIVVNNAILLVDHTNLLRRRDKLPTYQAIVEAGRRRLRPILMTATTTVIGLIPLALGLGEGGEAQAPMARTVIGGLTSSTLITLIVVPVVYALFEKARPPISQMDGQ
ncbi:MAG: efflux RND transporter permease subunit [Sedimentisphaerales bacterium]|nr:efflux RND transporter permease subunit [Sedimentisphaerales bacterium]